MRVFIDSNVPMYVAGDEDPNRQPARRFLDRVRGGGGEGVTSAEVLQEILYRYSAIRRLDLASEVYDLFVAICPEVVDVTFADTDGAKKLLCSVEGISARDAVHAAVMHHHGIEHIATFDRGFDRVPGTTRLDLADEVT